MKEKRQITLSEMAPHVHNFSAHENKTEKILVWFKEWITKSLSTGKIKPLDILPSKAELSYHMGVSIGTMQNVIRQLENMGFVESKQKIGTFIKSADNKTSATKLTSKREVAVEKLKKYILEKKYTKGAQIPSIRQLSIELKISNTTMRLAVMQLILDNILILKDRKYVLISTDFKNNTIEQETLVTKTAQQLKKYIEKDLKIGDKLPSTNKLAKLYNVSIKTVYDAVKLLTKEGLLYSRRGTYGTIVTSDNNTPQTYCYEQVEIQLREYISKNCKIGEKLPSIDKLAKDYHTSGKTIKKALDNLIQEGYLTSSRGRYGGIFILDIPQKTKDAYKWLALNTDYIPEMEN